MPHSIWQIRGWTLEHVGKNTRSVHTLIHTAYRCILCRYIPSSNRGVLYKTRYNNFTWVVFSRYPIRNKAHSWVTITKLLTELSVLGMCVTASMGIVKANVQEEGSEWKKVKLNTIIMQICKMHFTSVSQIQINILNTSKYLYSVIMKEAFTSHNNANLMSFWLVTWFCYAMKIGPAFHKTWTPSV